jgi:DNA-binding Xre family transcriptional regulator
MRRKPQSINCTRIETATAIDLDKLLADSADVKPIGFEMGRKLARLMKEQGWTDRTLGEKAMISHATVYKLRHGAGGQASVTTVYRVAKILGVRVCWFVFGEGGPDLPESKGAPEG